MGWAGHVARLKDKKHTYKTLVRIPEGENHLEDFGVDGKIILKWILKYIGSKGMDWSDMAEHRDI